MLNLLIAFGIIVLLKLVFNLSGYLRCIRYYNQYLANLNKPDMKFEELQPQIEKLFKEAGIHDSQVPYAEPVGYNKIYTATVSVLENISHTRVDVVKVITTMFHRAKGVYRNRMLESLNPLYWLQVIIFLPREIFKYLGTSPESFIVKIIQLIYWIISGFLLVVFPDEINTFIKGVFSNTIP